MGTPQTHLETAKEALTHALADCNTEAKEWAEMREEQYHQGLRRGLTIAVRCVSNEAFAAEVRRHGLATT